MSLSLVFNPLLSSGLQYVNSGTSVWGTPVADLTALQAITTDVPYTVRIVESVNSAYVWTGSAWVFCNLVVPAAVGSSPNANGFSLDAANTLTLQPADSTHPGVLTSGTQVLGGVKTFSSLVNANGGIDRSTAGTLSIGTNAATSTTLNIGNSSSTTNIQGTTIFENTTTLNVSNPTINLNVGAGIGSGASSGITVEENNVITGYAETSADRNSWTFKAPNTAGVTSLTPGTSSDTVVLRNTTDTLTNKTISGSSNTLSNIAYSSLVLSNSIVNSDINSSAAIAYSKLNLSSSIVNADISGSAAIAYSKLNLSASIINSDVASAAGIAVNKLAALSTNSAVVSDGSGFLSSSATTSTQIGYLSTTTSDIQTQINGKVSGVTGDIAQTTFAPANNQSAAANVTGLAFANGSVRSAKVVYSIVINATASLYEAGELRLIQQGAGWQIAQTSVGDDSLVVLSVTSAGQVQYTTPSYTGFSSSKMQFRALVTSI